MKHLFLGPPKSSTMSIFCQLRIASCVRRVDLGEHWWTIGFAPPSYASAQFMAALGMPSELNSWPWVQSLHQPREHGICLSGARFIPFPILSRMPWKPWKPPWFVGLLWFSTLWFCRCVAVGLPWYPFEVQKLQGPLWWLGSSSSPTIVGALVI